MTLIDSKTDTGEAGGGYSLQDEHPSDAVAYYSAYGQALTLNGNWIITSCKFRMQDNGTSPTGDLISKIYNTTGTMGSSALPTGNALTESTIIDSTTLTGAYVYYSFYFLGHNRRYFAAGDYAVDVEANSADFSDTNYAILSIQHGGNPHAGNAFGYVNNAWAIINATYDCYFYLYGLRVADTFNKVKAAYERTYSGDITVTQALLALGSQNAYTGWHALDYTTTTRDIEMVIVPKGSNPSVLPIGSYARYDYTGFCLDGVGLYDKITTAEGKVFRVLSSHEYTAGNTFFYNMVELEELWT